MGRPLGAVLTLGAALAAAGCGAEPPPPRVIVDAETGQLYGANRDGRWIAAGALDLATLDGVRLVHYGKGGRRGGRVALRQVPAEETCSNPSFLPSSDAPPEAGTYLAADWDAAPRGATELPTDNRTYQTALSEWLSTQGITDLTPVIAQLSRVDLDGDGSNEVVLAAERQRASITSTRAGDYSVLLLRRLEGGQVATVPLQTDLHLEDCLAECAPARYRLFSTLDLDGDGRLELIVTSEDYEGLGRAIHTLDDPTRPSLAWHCGP